LIRFFYVLQFSNKNKCEPIDKPGSVVDNHSSGYCVTTVLKRLTRTQYGPYSWVPI